MHKIKRIILAIPILCIPSLGWADPVDKHSGTVRIKHIDLHGSRIAALRIEIRNAAIESISNLPRGWSMDIENNPMPYAVLSGNTAVGAAAMDSRDLSRIVIRITEDKNGLQEFRLECSISTTKEFDEFQELNITDKCVYTH